MELASEVINPTPDSELRELYAELSLSNLSWSCIPNPALTRSKLELYTESSTG